MWVWGNFWGEITVSQVEKSPNLQFSSVKVRDSSGEETGGGLEQESPTFYASFMGQKLAFPWIWTSVVWNFILDIGFAQQNTHKRKS